MCTNQFDADTLAKQMHGHLKMLQLHLTDCTPESYWQHLHTNESVDYQHQAFPRMSRRLKLHVIARNFLEPNDTHNDQVVHT